MDIVELIFLKEIYTLILLLLSLMFFVSIRVYYDGDVKLTKIKNLLLLSFSLAIAIIFGFRDYNVGVDTNTYRYNFEYKFLPSNSFSSSKDFLWDFFNYAISRVTDDVSILFFIVALGYIFLPLLGVYKYLKQNTIFFFLLFLISPNFFLYGANGIRNGLAASLVLFSLRYYKNYKQYLILAAASLVHLSMLVPSLFFILSKYVKSITYPLLIWVILLLFAVLGVNLLALLPFSFERLDSFIMAAKGTDTLLNTITNFFVYSTSPIILGIYVIYIKKIKDELYLRLLITYILASCVYIAAFNSSFSVRFAYLSEFLMPLLLTYPLLKFRLWKYVEIKLVLIISIVFLIKSVKIFLS